MANVHDVAAYILKKTGPITAVKLQKLLYYSQAWSLVWDEKPLFSSRIEAWANGPVVPEVYQSYHGCFEVKEPVKGDSELLDGSEVETIDAVLASYGDKSSHWLSELTHREKPWLEARKGVAPGEPSSEIISQPAMAEYYDGLV
jgi:uncharacterized phage-associated protein